MKNLIFVSLFLFGFGASAQVKISQLPIGHASSTTTNDSLPFVNSTSAVTEQMTLWDLINLPPFQTQFQTMIPAQTGNAGKFLATNGTITSWQAVAGSANQFLSNLNSPTAINQNLIFNITNPSIGIGTNIINFSDASNGNVLNIKAPSSRIFATTPDAAIFATEFDLMGNGVSTPGNAWFWDNGQNNSLQISAPSAFSNTQHWVLPLTNGSAGQFLTTSGGSTETLTWSSVVPGGANTDVQYNSSGAFGGNSSFTYDGSTITANTNTNLNGPTAITGSLDLSSLTGNVFIGASLFFNRTIGFNIVDGTINNSTNQNAIDFVDSSCSNCLHIDADPATTVDITGPFLLEDNASGYHGNAVMVGNTSVRTLNASDGSTALNFFTPGVYSFGTGTVSSNNFLNQLTIFPSVSSSCVLTLTSASSQMYSITGPYGCVVNLPVVSTLQNGTTYILLYEGNSSTTNVNTSGGNLMATFNGFTGFNQELIATVIDNTAGTGLASWAFTFVYTDQTTAPITAVGGPMNANVTVGSPWQFDFGTNNRPIGNFYLKNIFLYDGSGDFIGEMAQGGGFTVGAQAGQNLILSTSDNGSGASNNINLHVGTASTAAGVGVVTVNTLLQLPVQTLGTAPANATNGSIALTSTYILCVYNGSGWVQTANGSVTCTF